MVLSLILLWSEYTLYDFSSFKCVETCFIPQDTVYDTCSMDTWERKVYSALVGSSVLNLSDHFVCIQIFLSLLISCLAVLLVFECGLLWFTIIIVYLSVFCFSSVRFYFMYLEALLLMHTVHWESFLFPYCWVLRIICLFWIQCFIRYVFCKYFFPAWNLSSYFLNSVFPRAEIFTVNEVQLPWFLLSWILLLMLYLKTHQQT